MVVRLQTERDLARLAVDLPVADHQPCPRADAEASVPLKQFMSRALIGRAATS